MQVLQGVSSYRDAQALANELGEQIGFREYSPTGKLLVVSPKKKRRGKLRQR